MGWIRKIWVPRSWADFQIRVSCPASFGPRSRYGEINVERLTLQFFPKINTENGRNLFRIKNLGFKGAKNFTVRQLSAIKWDGMKWEAIKLDFFPIFEKVIMQLSDFPSHKWDFFRFLDKMRVPLYGRPLYQVMRRGRTWTKIRLSPGIAFVNRWSYLLERCI